MRFKLQLIIAYITYMMEKRIQLIWAHSVWFQHQLIIAYITYMVKKTF